MSSSTPTDRMPLSPLGTVPTLLALTSGVLGVIANALVVAFWLISHLLVVDLTWGWLGPTSDAIGIGMCLALIPVVFTLRRLLPPSRVVAALTVLAIAALAIMVVLQLGTTRGLVGWDVQVRIVVGLLVPIYGWLIVVNSTAHRSNALPRTVTRLGLLLGVLWPAGLLLTLAGLLLGGADLDPLQLELPGGLLVAPGVALGTLGWLALPVWPLLLGTTALRRGIRGPDQVITTDAVDLWAGPSHARGL